MEMKKSIIFFLPRELVSQHILILVLYLLGLFCRHVPSEVEGL